MQLLAHVSGFVSQTVGPQQHIGGTSRFCFSIFSWRFLFKASKNLIQHNISYSLLSAYGTFSNNNQSEFSWQHLDSLRFAI